MISFKNTNSEYFNEKDNYEDEEVRSIVQDMECEIHTLRERIKELLQEKEEPDRYEDYRLGLI